ncbi:MAG: SDR family oxidoreductase [Verrucomicrobiota bacterium]
MKADFNQSTALVTGASSGLGEEFARQLGREVGTLVLVARREDRLQALAGELRQRHPSLRVEVVACDLAEETARAGLVERLQVEGLEVDLLINNAGLGDIGPVASANWEKLDAILQVNMTALTHLTRLLVPGMVARGRGVVLNVSSTAGFLPLPEFGVYAASKAYVNSFSEALRFELKDTGVFVTALCPGPVATEFGQVAARPDGGRQFAPPESLTEPAEGVVAAALAAARAGRPRVIPGAMVRGTMLLLESVPRPWLRGLLGAGEWVLTRFGRGA